MAPKAPNHLDNSYVINYKELSHAIKQFMPQDKDLATQLVFATLSGNVKTVLERFECCIHIFNERVKADQAMLEKLKHVEDLLTKNEQEEK